MRRIISATGLLILLLLGGVIIYRDLLNQGIPSTHDGSLHVIRMVNYYIALQQGQFPPRIGPNLANGLGYPVFNYNYPLANIAAIPFFKLHVSYEMVFKLVLLCFLTIGASGWWYYLKNYRIPRLYLIVGEFLYFFNPYLIQIVFVRGSVGELAATAVFPWVLWGIDRVITMPNFYPVVVLGVIGGLFSLTHNVLVLLSILPLGLYAIYQAKFALKLYIRLLVSVVIAFGVCAFFWLPALGEKSLVILDTATLNSDFMRHSITFSQLFSGEFGYGYSRPGPVDGLSFNFSVAEIVCLIMAMSWYIAQNKKNRILTILWISMGVSLLLTMAIGGEFWKIFPFGRFIQFPWRVLWISHIIGLMLIVFWLYKSKTKWWACCMLIILIIFSELPMLHAKNRDIRTNESWLRSGETTSTMNENFPKQLHFYRAINELKENISNEKPIWTSNPNAQISVHYLTGSRKQYQIETNEPITIVEWTAYFPGWEVYVDNRPVLVSGNDPWRAGLLTYQLPAGTHSITSTFTQHTPWRIIGNSVSGAVWLLVIVFMFIQIKSSFVFKHG